jgi:hypothetical protein
MRRSVAAGVVLAMAIVSGALIARGSDDLRSTLTRALATLPEATLTANYTDWRQVREVLDATGVTSATPQPRRQELLDAAYEDDLSAASGLAGSALTMAEPFGWSVFDLDWEIFGQAREGAVIVGGLSDTADPDDLLAALAELGYQRPESGADGGGVWRGGGDRLAAVGDSLTPMLEHVAVLSDERLVVLSDAPAYLEHTVDTITSGSGTLGELAEVAATAAPLDGALAAVVHRSPRNCAVTSYESASAADRQLAAARIAEVGGLGAHRGLGFGVVRVDGELYVTVSMPFDTAADAERERDPRTDLAHGPAIGQGGTYDERFSLVSATVADTDLVLRLRPREDRMSLVSDLASGPLLFSGCGG